MEIAQIRTRKLTAEKDTICPVCSQIRVGARFVNGMCFGCATADDLSVRLSRIDIVNKNRAIVEERKKRSEQRKRRVSLVGLTEEEKEKMHLKDGRTVAEARKEASMRRALPRCKKCKIVFDLQCPRCKRPHGVRADEDPRYCIDCFSKFFAPIAER